MQVQTMIPMEREWHLTPVFLPGESHGQRNLVGYSPRGHNRVGHSLATKTANNNIQVPAKQNKTQSSSL